MSSLVNNCTTATYTKSQPNNRCRISCGLFYGTSHRALNWMTHCIHCLQTSLYLICEVKLKCCSENSEVVTYVHTYIHACTNTHGYTFYSHTHAYTYTHIHTYIHTTCLHKHTHRVTKLYVCTRGSYVG